MLQFHLQIFWFCYSCDQDFQIFPIKDSHLGLTHAGEYTITTFQVIWLPSEDYCVVLVKLPFSTLPVIVTIWNKVLAEFALVVRPYDICIIPIASQFCMLQVPLKTNFTKLMALSVKDLILTNYVYVRKIYLSGRRSLCMFALTITVI